MKTAFQGELNLMNNYYEGPPQQSPRFTASESGTTTLNLGNVFKVSSALTASSGFNYSILGITNARAALATSYFIGFGSFLAFIMVIAFIRIIYFASKRRNNRANYNNPNSQSFIVRSSDDIISNNYGSDEFPAISNRARV